MSALDTAAYLFISHDLSVVRHICERVVVMYLGKIVGTGSREDIFTAPRIVVPQRNPCCPTVDMATPVPATTPSLGLS